MNKSCRPRNIKYYVFTTDNIDNGCLESENCVIGELYYIMYTVLKHMRWKCVKGVFDAYSAANVRNFQAQISYRKISRVDWFFIDDNVWSKNNIVILTQKIKKNNINCIKYIQLKIFSEIWTHLPLKMNIFSIINLLCHHLQLVFKSVINF